MLGVRSAAAIAKKDELSPGSKRFGRAHREGLDPREQFVGEALFHPAAFAELPADLLNMRAHRFSDEDDLIPMAGDAAGGVARIHDELRRLDDHLVVVAAMVGG